MENRKGLARMEFARQLKRYREAAGISQGSLAKATGKYQPNIVAIENGEVSIGIDNIQEIAECFGMKYYDFANPDLQLPVKAVLRQNIRSYLVSKHIDPSYLDDEDAPGYTRNIDLYLSAGHLREAKSSYQIAAEYDQLFQEKISPSRVTDILTRAPRDKKVKVIRPAAGRGNLYQYAPGNEKVSN